MEDSEKVYILIVDDREENLISLESIIEGPDRQIISANSGNEALRLSLKYNFDLILSDVQMPEMDGFEMLELLRKDPSKRHIPFIFLTAISKEDRYMQKGYSGGAVDYLFKPLNVDITRSKVNVFIELAKQKKLIEKKNKELEKLQEQKNLFMGILAHDLRNPIAAISYNCKFLIDESHNLTEEQKEIIGLVSESSAFMLNMVNNLLDLSEIESGKFTISSEAIDLKKLLQSVLQTNSFFAKDKNINLIHDFSESLTVAVLDAHKIRQVLNNLITNAIKFSPPQKQIILKGWLENNTIYFSVKDEGPGIAETQVKKIFNQYEKGESRATAGEKSTGLGLYICQRIVEAHGGSVTINSILGIGSEFIVSLPYVKPVQQEVEKIISNIGSSKVLVVDDNDLNQTFLKRLLEAMNCKVVVAGSGKEAIEEAKKQDIDLILMDVEMPEVNGIDATKEILKNSTNIKIVGCTGYQNDFELSKCYEAGMIKCIKKPVSKNSLLEVLQLINTK